MTSDKAKAKADALLVAGDALASEFPAKSRELLRLCRHFRCKQKELKEADVSDAEKEVGTDADS